MKTLKYFLSTVLLVSFIWSCTKDQYSNIDFLSTVQTPTNVSALFSVTQDNTGVTTITPTSDGAVSYQVTLGDDTASPVTVKQSESITHTYGEGNYLVKLIATGITGLKTEATKDLVVSFKVPKNLAVVIDNDLAISKKVNVTTTADFATSFDVYFGETLDETPVSANIGKTASFVYQQAGTYAIRVVVKGAAIATTEKSVDFEVTAILQPFASAPAPQTRAVSDVVSIYSSAYSDVVGTNYNPDWGQSGQGSNFAEFDLNGDKMLQYINLSYQGIALADGTSVDVSGMEFLHLDVWTTDVTDLEVSLIQPGPIEAPVSKALVADQWNSIDIPVKDYLDQGLTLTDLFQLKLVGTPWAGGTVFVDNIYFYNNTPTAPTTAAPTPSTNAADVISIYSDAYTGITLNEVNPNWGQTTTLTEVQVAGNNTWLYENLNFTGIVTDYGNATDISAMTYVHFDYWTPDASVLGLKLVNTNHSNGDPLKEDIKFVSNVKLGSWQGVDILLSDYTTDPSGITQILFDTSGNNAKVYIDNLYFYSASAAPITAAPSPTSNSASVISVYSDAYTNITVNQWNPNWGQNTVLVNINIGGNNTLKYNNLDFTGIVTDYGSPTNVSNKTYIHFDYWTKDATSLEFKLENTFYANGDPLKGSQVAVSSITTGAWVGVDIPLSSFTTDKSGITQMLFVSSGKTVYIDNIYFY